jgi:hypothetical protein
LHRYIFASLYFCVAIFLRHVFLRDPYFCVTVFLLCLADSS